ncbi:hypothetical protein [Haloarcula sp. CBA1131]|nr:hypothetical protein [Haloarcula sp. CBA1131]
MSTEQQSVDEQSSDEADEGQGIRAQHHQAQASGEVFQGRPHGER